MVVWCDVSVYNVVVWCDVRVYNVMVWCDGGCTMWWSDVM